MPIEIQKPLKKLLPYLLKAQEDSLNEADTVQRLTKVFEDVLGYNPMTEVTREMQVKDKYVDITIKADDTIRFLVEAKAAGVTLRERHIDQAERYAAEGNIPWVILTNGVHWHLYHLTFDEGIEYEEVFEVDLATDPMDRVVECFTLLHRQSVRGKALESFWEQHTALSPESIGRALFAEDTLGFIRRNIRRQDGILIDVEDLAGAIHAMFSNEAREKIA